MKNNTLKRMRRFFKRFGIGKGRVAIARVSDFLDVGIDRDWLAGEFERVENEVWGEITDEDHRCSKSQILESFQHCPHMIYGAFLDGEVVATQANIKTTMTDMTENKTWLEKTGGGTFATHKEDGDVAFGAALSVSKETRQGIGTRMVIYPLVVSLVGEGLRSVYLGARIPGYKDHSDMQVEDYVFGKRPDGRPLDGEIHFFQRSGFEIVEVIPGYMKDPDSLDYGVLMKWDTPRVVYKLMKWFPFVRWLIQSLGVRFLLRIPKLAPRA